MGIKSIFRRLSNRPARSFSEVDKMLTRRLPIPNVEKAGAYIQFFAEQNKSGHWVILSHDKGFDETKKSSEELKLSAAAIRAAFIKHLGKNIVREMEMNFDEALLILRELEESYLKYSNAAPGKEPLDHYMAACRLLPQQFQDSLNEIYCARQDKGDILPQKRTCAPPPKGANP